jgi:anti-sigma factor RsiW
MTPRDIACNELVELLTEYLEGTLPPDEAAAIEEHLRGCDGCRTYLDQLRTTIELLGSATVDALSEQAYEELLAAFGRDAGPDPQPYPGQLPVHRVAAELLQQRVHPAERPGPEEPAVGRHRARVR